MNKSPMTLIIECVIIAVVLLTIFLLLSGCALFQKTPEITALTSGQQLAKTLSQTHWLVTFSILGAGAGFFAFLNGYGKGLKILAACLLVASLTLMVSWYGRWLATIGIVGSVVLLGYTIFTKTRALKQIVKGIDMFKTNPLNDSYPILKDSLNFSQKSETTKKIVKSLRGK